MNTSEGVSIGRNERRHLGIYSRTIVPSPVVRWILRAQIREPRFNDVVFIGEDFVHVKQLQAQGNLRHIATKTDFDARIRAAAVLGHGLETSSVDFLIKPEPDESTSKNSASSPQIIVLTLDSDELMFLFLRSNGNGTHQFVHEVSPLPSFDRALYQLGEHLCIDPSSHAIAVGAVEQELFMCTVKGPQQMRTEVGSHASDWVSVTSERSFRVDGIIHKLAILTPHTDDADHIILVLIVIDSGRTKAMWIDWHRHANLCSAELHSGQALDSMVHTASLLIPLKDTSFLLIKGLEIVRWKNLLSGSADGDVILVDAGESKYPGVSSAPPIWASWTKPCRNQTSRRDKDDIYLAREDGKVLFLSLNVSGATHISRAGDLECHVGSAFASLGDELDPDLLAIGGDMSSGRIVKMGVWAEYGRSESLSWNEAMSMSVTHLLPNWTSTMDMLPTDLGASSSIRHKHSHGFYVTAGREPHGTITELRKGFEARISAYFDLDALRSIINIWALPDLSSAHVLLVISRPTSTQLLTVTSDGTEVAEIQQDNAFNTTQKTLAAGTASNDRLIQVTPHSICITSLLDANFQDTSNLPMANSTEILAAVVIPQQDAIITAERDMQKFRICQKSMTHPPDQSEAFDLAIPSEPLDIAAVVIGMSTVIAVTTSDNSLILILIKPQCPPLSYVEALPADDLEGRDGMSVCDHVLVLHSASNREDITSLLVVCGLRDGRVVSYHVNFDQANPFGARHTTKFSNSTVKLVPFETVSDHAIAMNGQDICLLYWPGHGPNLLIENIWASDKSRPELMQGSAVACTVMPPAALLSSPDLADSLIMVCEDEILIGTLERTISTVPREISTSGTPNRFIYSEELRCLVCASECSGIRLLPSPHSAPEMKRQRWPVIDFVPLKHSGPSFTYPLQPGERIHALLAWSHRSSEEKTYLYILVGGSYLKSNGVRRGRVSLLQPQIRNREVVGLHNEPHNIKFDSEVLALASYDAITFIACSGDCVFLYRFMVDAKKWNPLCPPFRLASPGVCVSTQQDSEGRRFITVSTARDSVITLVLLNGEPEVGLETSFQLVPVSMGPSAEISQSHLTLSEADIYQDSESFGSLTLLSTKDARLIGLACPDVHPADMLIGAGADLRWKQAETMFEAQLPCSLRKIRQCGSFERKGSTSVGVVDCRLVGSRTDGAVVGLALLQPQLWRRLAWLQRLCEWSEDLSPHSFQYPVYGTKNDVGDERALPIGLQGQGNMVLLHTSMKKSEDLHIDGDVVARVLRHDGSDALKKMLRQLTHDEGAVGAWMREHLEEELQAVDKVTEIVRRLDSWI